MAAPRLYYDRVKEVTSTTGTGNVTLAGAVTNFVTFASVVATGSLVPYRIESDTQWEVGVGTLSAATTLQRTTVITGSSGAGSAVNFSAGTKLVSLDPSAQEITRCFKPFGRLLAMARGQSNMHQY